jgi:hypothetical protein
MFQFWSQRKWQRTVNLLNLEKVDHSRRNIGDR